MSLVLQVQMKFPKFISKLVTWFHTGFEICLVNIQFSKIQITNLENSEILNITNNSNKNNTIKIILTTAAMIDMTLTQTISPNCIALHMDKQGVHSHEVGALPPVFEKSAKNSNTNKNYINIKTQIHIVTLNVRNFQKNRPTILQQCIIQT